MNFGYPFTPYAPNMPQEQYMGNVGTNMNMANMQGMNPGGSMPTQGMGCCCGMNTGFNAGMTTGLKQQPGCNQVEEQTCAVDMPYYVNYNTHGNTN